MQRARPRDDASTHVLEAVIVACVMLSAVAYVSTYSPPTSSIPDAPLDRVLQSKGTDLLGILHDWPLPAGRCEGARVLDDVVVSAARAEPHEFAKRKSNVVGEHMLANLQLSNGVGRLPLVREFDGFANVGISYPYDPTWEEAMAVPMLPTVTGQERLKVLTMAHSDGEPLHPRGDALRTTVWLTDGSVIETWSLVGLFKTDRERAHVDMIRWARPVTSELYFDASKNSVPPFLRLPFDVHLIVGASAEIATPEGVRTHVDFPPGWDGTVIDAAGWSASYSYQGAHLSQLTFEAGPLTPADATIQLRLLPPASPPRAYDILTARLSNGSLGQSSLVVTYPDVAEKGLPRVAAATVPYPLAHGAVATLGVAFANGGPQEVQVERIVVDIPGGYDREREGKPVPLFAGDPSPVAGPAGSWTMLDATRLEWRPSSEVKVSGGAARSWVYDVPVTSDAAAWTGVEPATSKGGVSRLTFSNGHVHESRQWGPAPGVYVHEVLPDDPATEFIEGYPWSAPPPGELLEESFEAVVAAGWTEVDTRGTYLIGADASELARPEGALGNGTARVRERVVPAGGVVQVDVDLEDVVTELAAAGASSLEIVVELHAPIGSACGKTKEWSRPVDALPVGHAKQVLLARDPSPVGPAAFALWSDSTIYALDLAGQVMWSFRPDPLPTVMATAGLGAQTALYVGDIDGQVTRYDAAATGVWKARVAEGVVSRSVAGMAVSPDGSMLLARTDAAVAVLTEGGAALGRRALALQAAAWTPAGEVVLLEPDRVSRATPALVTLADEHVPGGVALGVSAQNVYVTRETGLASSETIVLALDLHEQRAVIAHLGSPLTVTAGEATGDSVEDGVVALDTLVVVVIDGSTHASTQRVAGAPPVPSAGTSQEEVEQWLGLERRGGGLEWRDDDRSPYATCASHQPVSYQSGRVCLAADDEVPITPLLLHAAAGRVAFAYEAAGQGRLVHWRHDDSESYELSGIKAAAVGAWHLGVRVVLVAQAEGGLVRLVDEETGSVPLWAAAPPVQAGRFSFAVPVPPGSFFGQHALRATLSWMHQSGGVATAASASLLEWFDVSGVDGKPVSRPAYRLELTLRDPFRALERCPTAPSPSASPAGTCP